MKYHVAGFGNRNSIFRMKVVCNFGRSKLKKNKRWLDRIKNVKKYLREMRNFDDKSSNY